MTGKQVAENLREEGHKIEVYVRPDGGIRITKIDGIKFSKSNSDGVNFARGLLGENLSKKAYEQRRANEQATREGKQRQRMKYPTLTIRKCDTPETRKKKLAVKRKLRKARRHRKVNMRQVSQKLRREGYEKTITSLENIAKHDAGLAYESAVEALADFTKEILEQAGEEMRAARCFDKLVANKQAFPDASIVATYDTLYDVQQTIHYMAASATDQEAADWLARLTMQCKTVEHTIDDGVTEGKELYKNL